MIGSEATDSNPYGIRLDPEDARRFYAQGLWREQTLIDDFRAVVESHPGKEAVVQYDEHDGRTAIAYAELSDAVDRIAAGLVAAGVQSGDRVAFQLPNRWELVALALACAQAGAVAVPLPPALRERELAYALELVECPLLVAVDDYRGFAYGELAARLAAEIPTLREAVVLGDPPPGTTSFADAFLDRPAGPRGDRPRHADDVAEILFTSGTTGEPKGVMHTSNTQWTRICTIRDTLALTDRDAIVIGLTLAHAAGWEYGFLTPIALGMTIVVQETWDADAMLDVVERERATWSFGTTPFLVDAVRAQRRRPRDIPTFRYFVSGGAAIPPRLVHEVHEELGARVMAVWGQTENGAPTCTRFDDPPDSAATSDGRALEWLDVGIFGDDDRELPRGEVGELRVRGATLAVGYFKRPELFDATLTADGWFRSGDLARMDERGYVRIVGRQKDIIIRGGDNIPTVEVESALFDHPAVAEVAIVPYPDERLGERACAVVVPHAGAEVTLASLQGHLELAGMSKVFWPEKLRIVDSLPKTPSGKVAKAALREALEPLGDAPLDTQSPVDDTAE